MDGDLWRRKVGQGTCKEGSLTGMLGGKAWKETRNKTRKFVKFHHGDGPSSNKQIQLAEYVLELYALQSSN